MIEASILSHNNSQLYNNILNYTYNDIVLLILLHSLKHGLKNPYIRQSFLILIDLLSIATEEPREGVVY